MRIADVSMVVAIGALSLTAFSWSSSLEAPAVPQVAGIRQAAADRAAAGAGSGPAVSADAIDLRVSGSDVEATRRGLAALATIDYDWQTQLPGWEISFHSATDGAYGYTLTQENRIDIYVRDNQPDSLLAHVIAHEMGHAVDVTKNDGDDRRRWLEVRGIEGAPWWPDNRAADFATGAGDFAESFAAWQLGDVGFRSELGLPPSPEARAVLAQLAWS